MHGSPAPDPQEWGLNPHTMEEVKCGIVHG